MKLVREHINEKFTEDSDPIKDLKIGLYKEFDSLENMCNYIIKNLPMIIGEKEIPKDIINEPGKFIRVKYYRKIQDHVVKYFILNHRGFWPGELQDILIKMGFQR